MSTLPAACAVLALALPALPGLAATPANDPQLAAHIDAILAANYPSDAPGAAVIVVKDGQPVLRKAYGLADVAHKKPMAPDMVLRLGSITKQFTATGILMLADEGKLQLTDDIRTYLPDFPDHGKTITIQHLLGHTSGIVNYTSKPDFVANMAKDRTLAQLIATFRDDPLEFDPGARFAYSNSGYILLGAIIEKVSGIPFDQFVAQRIFVPLHMDHTAYEGHERTAGTKALGYARDDKGFEPAPAISMTQPYAAGALVSTVDDLARWDAAVSSAKLLKAATWQQAFTANVLNSGERSDYGDGWFVGKLYGAVSQNHSGGIPGYMAHVVRVPSEHVFVAVLSNADGGIARPDQTANTAAALAMGKPYAQRKEIALPATQLDAFRGVYSLNEPNNSNNPVFRRAGDHLTMQFPGTPPVLLRAFSDTGFYNPASLAWVEFGRDKQGKVDRVTLHDVDTDRVHMRVADAPPERLAKKIDPAKFDAHAGRYQLMPNFVVALTRTGDRYFAQATGQNKVEVFAAGDDVFFSDAASLEMHFDPAKPDEFVLFQGGQNITAKKLP